MPKVMKQRRESNHLSPREERFFVGKKIHIGMTTALVGEDVENPASQFHDAKGMLEPAMGRARIDEIRQCELVNVTKALKRA